MSAMVLCPMNLQSTAKAYESDSSNESSSSTTPVAVGPFFSSAEAWAQSRGPLTSQPESIQDLLPPLKVPVEPLLGTDIDAAMEQVFEDEANDDDDDDEQQQQQQHSTTTSLPLEDEDDALPQFIPDDDEALVNMSSDTAQPRGGLENLGNTCYMASALQMLASLEPFLDAIDREPADTDNDLTLRTAFLELQSRLMAGETVKPDQFKDAVDERSSLFQGYRQQDAHEFTTTLLDLLDADYAIKKQEPADVDSDESDDANVNQEAAATVDVEDAVMEDRDDASMETSPKRARTESYVEDAGEQDTMGYPMLEQKDQRPVLASLPTRPSFSELDLNDIGQLLHGTPSCRETLVFPSTTAETSTSSSPAASAAMEPRCKLAGGRMNTTDVVLTPYDSATAQALHVTSPMDEETTGDAPSGRSTASDKGEPVLSAAPSPVDNYFQTSVRVRLTCDSCKYSRTHQETFLHLSLEIGSTCGSSNSVDDGLRRFFAPERREVKCEKCFCETASQSMEITKLPAALLLHFKRFIVDVSPDYSSVTYRKNQSAVAFGASLSLQDTGIFAEFLAMDCEVPTFKTSGTSTTGGCSQQADRYSIRSVVNHIGSSASRGHYTADAFRLLDNAQDDGSTREWLRFNDCSVSSISALEAVEDSRKTAYMVVYELE